MKLKFKSEKLPRWIPVSKLWQLKVLLLLVCLYVLPISSLADDGNVSRKINLKVGDVLNYQLNETYFYEHDTVKSSSWFNFKVVGKKDTLYSMVCIPNGKITSTKNTYSDTRFREKHKDFLSLEDYQTIPFYLSESGIVQPVAIPDSITKRLIKEKYPNDLHGASTLIHNLENYQNIFSYIFQQFFIDWHSTKEGLTTTKLNYRITNSTLRDVSPSQDFSEIVSEFQISPADTLNGPIRFPLGKGKSRITIDRISGTISKMEVSTTFTRYKIKNPAFKEADNPQRHSIQIRKFIPRNDSTVTITGTLDKNCNPQTFNCYIITNYIGRGDKFSVDKNIEPGKSFRLEIPLKWPVATNLSIGNFGTYSSFLLEPGDSIHLTITPNGVEFSGKDALKSKLCMAMRESRLNIETSLPEVQAKEEAEKWIVKEQQKIEPFKDQISWWAYNQIRCDIYYSAMDNLISYYYYKNGQKVNAASFKVLFDTIKWDDYQCFSSMDMMRFIHSYLYRKLLIMKGEKENRMISESEKYHLAKIIFKNKIKYHALSQCVYEALKGNRIEEGQSLFYDYEKTYRGTGFYPYLKNKLETRVDLGNGATVPEFNATDMKGKKITLDKLKGKYVQLLFINLEYGDDTLDLKSYQKLKEDLPIDKFEMITVFVNKNTSLTDAYIKKNHLKGILISNPVWQVEQLKKFRSENTSPYYLVNPKGIIVFGGAGSPNDYFVNMIIEMINNDNYNNSEASVSKSTLYWVLSLSLLAIIFTLVLVWFVTKAIKKREAMRREQLELKLSAVRSQLNPHFLFNAMTSIQYLVNHDEKEKANLFLSKFAQLMRKVLLQSETERVPLSDELATIETYLELEALRHRFNYRIQVDEKIDQHNTEIPVMLLQPFVENAVIHGIAHLAEKGIIKIKVEKWENNQLKIKIIDNGLGYSNEVSVHSGSNGKGMQITRKRVDLMMAKYGHEIDFKVINRKELDVSLCGTEVVITFETEK